MKRQVIDLLNPQPKTKIVRPCGPCDACCFIMHVPTLNKPQFTACPHQRAAGGCGIHMVKPPVCSAWQCLWSKSTWPDDWRPDICGLLILLAIPAPGQQQRGPQPYAVYEIRHHAIRDNKQIIEKLLREKPVLAHAAITRV